MNHRQRNCVRDQDQGQQRVTGIGCSGRSGAHQSAFTLVEVLLVLAILAAIASMVIPNLLNRQKTANVDATRINITATEQALKMYAIDHAGVYPDVRHAIDSLMQAPSQDYHWNGPYLERAPTDAWGHNLRCREASGSGRLQVFSAGPDARVGTEDDIFRDKTGR